MEKYVAYVWSNDRPCKAGFARNNETLKEFKSRIKTLYSCQSITFITIQHSKNYYNSKI